MRYEMSQPLPMESSRSERAAFIRRTYAHLAGAILAFVALEAVAFTLLHSVVEQYLRASASSRVVPFVILALYIGASYLARYWAFNGGSAAVQYAGLGLYIVVMSVVFVPLLYTAIHFSSPDVIPQAAILTLCLFAGLTAVVFTTGKDFSFLGPIIAIASSIALGVILCSFLFPIGLGLWFSLAMIVLAAGAILYDTSNILLHFRMDQHVAASLSLFASVAMLFYYVLLALMQSRR